MSNKTEIVVRGASYRKVFSAISGEGVFQHPQAISLIDLGMMSEMEIFHHLTSSALKSRQRVCNPGVQSIRAPML
jgi:hypothetical protein